MRERKRVTSFPGGVISLISLSFGTGNAETVQLKVVICPGFTRVLEKRCTLGEVTVIVKRQNEYSEIHLSICAHNNIIRVHQKIANVLYIKLSITQDAILN